MYHVGLDAMEGVVDDAYMDEIYELITLGSLQMIDCIGIDCTIIGVGAISIKDWFGICWKDCVNYVWYG